LDVGEGAGNAARYRRLERVGHHSNEGDDRRAESVAWVVCDRDVAHVSFDPLLRRTVATRFAADDGALEEVCAAERRREEAADVHAANRLPIQAHPPLVAAEMLDVVVDPVEGLDLIEKTVVTRRPVRVLCSQALVREVPQQPVPVMIVTTIE
jgi:hypothetical protein